MEPDRTDAGFTAPACVSNGGQRRIVVAVQVGVSGAGVPVVEFGRDQSPGADLRHSVGAGAGECGVVLEYRERGVLRRNVGRPDSVLDVRARVHSPQQGGGLDRREEEVVAGHGVMLAACLLCLDPPDLGPVRFAARVAPDDVQAAGDTFGERGELPVPGKLTAQRGVPDRVADEPVPTVAGHPRTPVLVDVRIDEHVHVRMRAETEKGTHLVLRHLPPVQAEQRSTTAGPVSWRVALLRVVSRRVSPCGRLGVTQSRMTDQVQVARPGGYLRERHHRPPAPFFRQTRGRRARRRRPVLAAILFEHPGTGWRR